MAHYMYQTVDAVTSDADDSVITGLSAAGAFIGSAVAARKPKMGARPVEVAPDDRKPYRFTPDGATGIARFLIADAGVLTRWASTPDAGERLALLQSTGIVPVITASALTPTVSELAAMRSLGRDTFAAMLATGGFVRETARGGKAAATAAGKRAATASERTAAVLDDLFAVADALPMAGGTGESTLGADGAGDISEPKSRKSRG